MQENVIEISPLAYMRGRTFKNAVVIADEMQNSSPNQMLMLTTRIGVGSKMVITGDLNQTDRGFTSGLSDFVKKYKLYKSNADQNTTTGIEIVELKASDISRDPIIATILDIYNSNDSEKKVYLPATPSEVLNKTVQEMGVTKNINLHLNQDAALIPIQHMSSKPYNSL